MAVATHILTHLYDRYDDAAAAVNRLEEAGIPHTAIGVLAGQGEGPQAEAGGAATGATLGTVLGGGAGLLAGIGVLAIPGVGPVVAAGWLVATLTGAGLGAVTGGAAGGIIDGLTSHGVGEADAHVYAEGVRRGGALLSVKVDDAQMATARTILEGHGPVDPVARRGDYEAGGWTRFDSGERADASEWPGGVDPLNLPPI